MIASHSNSQAVFFHTRNLTDNQFTAIIEYRGVVGLNAYAGFLSGGGASAADLLRHLEHFLALGGAKTVRWAETGMDATHCRRAIPASGTGLIFTTPCCSTTILSRWFATFFMTI